MLTLNNIHKSFFDQCLFKDLSIEVEAGKSVVILGQSGVGKTTLLKIMAGLVHPDSGEVTVATDKKGMLFQKDALFDSLTALENLDFVLQESLPDESMTREAREQLCQKYLEWVELGGKGDLYPDELSGGMQKRLAIARTLILRPEVILYDEPTAGLDPITSRLISDLILRMKKEMHSTLVIVTSDIFRAFQLGDCVYLLVKMGREGTLLKKIGTPEMAKESLDPYVKQFIHGEAKGPLNDFYRE